MNREKTKQEQEPLMDLSPKELAEYIVNLGEKVTKIEQEMDKASRILEDRYGLSVEQVLDGEDQ